MPVFRIVRSIEFRYHIALSITNSGWLSLLNTGPMSLSSVTLTGGTLSNAGTLNIGSLNVNLQDGWGATLGGTGAVNLTGTGGLTKINCCWSGATLTVDGGKVLTNTVSGSFTESGFGTPAGISATVALSGGSSIVNAGTWTLNGGQVVAGAGQYGNYANGGFSNTGTLGSGTATINDWGGFANGGALGVALTNTGRHDGQGVGFMEDGSMVVVNGGVDLVDAGRMPFTVSSVVPTSAGRIVFARLDDARVAPERVESGVRA